MEGVNSTNIKWVEQRFEQKDLMPNVIENPSKELKTNIFKTLVSHQLMNLATTSPNGWPIVDCMHYAIVEGENLRPVFYLFTFPNKRKLVNIKSNSRVSVSLYNDPGFEKRNEAWFFQFIGIARTVDDIDEIKVAVNAMRSKPNSDYTQNMPLEKQPCIRIDILFGTWMDQSQKPPLVTIDYGQLI